jgi:hypothetical protein
MFLAVMAALLGNSGRLGERLQRRFADPHFSGRVAFDSALSRERRGRRILGGQGRHASLAVLVA